MKQKRMVYFLGFAVVIVWGIIIFRIVASVNNKDDYQFQEKAPAVKEAYNDYETPPDTAQLLLNYRDPFGASATRDTIVKLNIKPVINSRPQPIKIPQNWNFVRYSGYVRNPGNKKLIAMLSINGKTTMLAEGETEAGVKLLQNLKDSVKISFKNQTKYLTINTASL